MGRKVLKRLILIDESDSETRAWRGVGEENRTGNVCVVAGKCKAREQEYVKDMTGKCIGCGRKMKAMRPGYVQ